MHDDISKTVHLMVLGVMLCLQPSHASADLLMWVQRSSSVAEQCPLPSMYYCSLPCHTVLTYSHLSADWVFGTSILPDAAK